MPRFTKGSVVKQISNETGLTQQDVANVYDRVFSLMYDTLVTGRSVHIQRFGVLLHLRIKGRNNHNPKRPEQKGFTPARTVLRFRPCKELKAAVANATPIAPRAPIKPLS